MSMTLEEWKQSAGKGTSGDMVWNILTDWEEDRKAKPVQPIGEIEDNELMEEYHYKIRTELSLNDTQSAHLFTLLDGFETALTSLISAHTAKAEMRIAELESYTNALYDHIAGIEKRLLQAKQERKDVAEAVEAERKRIGVIVEEIFGDFASHEWSFIDEKHEAMIEKLRHSLTSKEQKP